MFSEKFNELAKEIGLDLNKPMEEKTADELKSDSMKMIYLNMLIRDIENKQRSESEARFKDQPQELRHRRII